jgi:hypothetical protein
MVMTEDEFAEKARQEYSDLSRRKKKRLSKSESSLKSWLRSLARRIWQGIKDVAKGFIASLAAALAA